VVDVVFLDGESSTLKNVTRFSTLFSGDVLEVSVFEEGGVFEAVAQETIEGDVGDPYEGYGRSRLPVQEIACEEKGDGEPEGVSEVISCGAEARVDQVAGHEEIRSQEEDCEEQPAVVQVLVEEEDGGEKEGFFDAEKDGWAGQHVMFIRCS
jgi:hypothetical protein